MLMPPRTRRPGVEGQSSPIVDQDAASLELSELRHRTENLLQAILSLLNLEARRAEQDETKERLHDLALRVDLLAGLHRRLNTSGPGGELNAGALIRSTASAIIAPHGGRIDLELEVEDVPLDGRRAQSLALLVHEALTNVTRHAFAATERGRVVVRARPTAEGGFVVEVEDNGRGMRDEEGSSGFGLRLMRALALRLGGELQLGDGSAGLKLTLRVPPPEQPVDEGGADPSGRRKGRNQPIRARRARRSSALCSSRAPASSVNGLAHSTS